MKSKPKLLHDTYVERSHSHNNYDYTHTDTVTYILPSLGSQPQTQEKPKCESESTMAAEGKGGRRGRPSRRVNPKNLLTYMNKKGVNYVGESETKSGMEREEERRRKEKSSKLDSRLSSRRPPQISRPLTYLPKGRVVMRK